MQRKEQVNLPFEMIREAVVNALIHRDYDIAGQKCQLVANSDMILVKSPGGPIPPVTLAQLQSFSAPMKSRNPVLHYVFARMGMAEEQGFGLKLSLRDVAESLGLPLPTFAMEGDYLVVTIYRNSEAAIRTLNEEVLESLSESEKAGWKWLSTTRAASAREYASALEVTDRTARRHLSHFLELGLVRKSGSGPYTEYEVV
jgi:ATP-dependent DNA helicase RecG